MKIVVGFNNNMYPTSINGKILEEYRAWCNMLYRCTEKSWEENPSYSGVICSENFKSYTFFYEWCQEQIGFGYRDESGKSWHLDKDILVRGNKVYSENTCCFVPARINSLFVKRKATRGKFPIGVSWYNPTKKYLAHCRNEDKVPKHIGYFDTKEDAFKAYKTYKESLIRYIANDYKATIDPRVYQALMKYEVGIDD